MIMLFVMQLWLAQAQTTSARLPNATPNSAYSYQLVVAGGNAPYVFQLIRGNLPRGMTLSPTGMLSGIPQLVGDYEFTVQVDDGGNSGLHQLQQKTYRLRVLPAK